MTTGAAKLEPVGFGDVDGATAAAEMLSPPDGSLAREVSAAALAITGFVAGMDRSATLVGPKTWMWGWGSSGPITERCRRGGVMGPTSGGPGSPCCGCSSGTVVAATTPEPADSARGSTGGVTRRGAGAIGTLITTCSLGE